MSRERPRSPSPEELRLWRAVTETVAPLGGRAEPEPTDPSPEPEPLAKTTAHVATVQAPPKKTARSAPALSPIDRRMMSRLGRGSVRVDARIDLHGMTQATAHGRLVRFLREAQADGARLVLVITGKGRPGGADAAGEARGVLRRLVPMLLASPELRPFVVGFGEAAPAHGGAGALYVRIRRNA